MRRIFLLLAIALFNFGVFGQAVTEGSLLAKSRKGTDLGACPLKTTAVRADISGFIARVNVRQEFENSYTEAIEAVYTFPLAHNGAVDQMTMTIGERVISGKIMKREEARQAYETAKASGQAASLLDQERANIFTQAVANIMPGEKIVIEISYVETLKYEDGVYEFVFPMTVGPRYIPGRVVDAAKISPPVAATRAGHDISIDVNLNAGVPVEEIRSISHQIEQINVTPNIASVKLRTEKTIPNKDFVFRYDVSGKRIEDAVLAHRGERGGFFTLVLQPPDRIADEDRTPKEIVFVLDTSGSMSGFPIEKAKEAMKLSLDGLYPDDTFNLITFAGDTEILFEEPVPATQANIEKAQAFLESRQGGGGTELMKAIKAALDPSDSKEHLRIVCFMTDAFVGNDDEIVAEIQKHPRARVFAFGIGSSVNRSLLDRMAKEGNGEVEYVSLDDDGSKAAKKFYERVRTPLLTDLAIDWNGIPVADVYPSKIGDLFSAKPVIVNGRYAKGGTGTIKLRGTVAGMPYERNIAFNLPDAEPANNVLATLWARRRVDELTSASLNARLPEKFNIEITKLGLDFGIMTQFTSFVAVEERVVNHNGTPTRIAVPVNIPEGVDREKAGGAATGNGTGSGYGSGSGLVQSRSVQNLPLQSRSPSNLVGLTPGTTSSGTPGGLAETVTVTSSDESVLQTSSSVSTTFKNDGKGNMVPSSSGGPDLNSSAKNNKRPRKLKGPGSGSSSGNGNGGSPPTASTSNSVANVTDIAVAKPQSPSPEQLRERRMKEVLHAWIYALVTRLGAGKNEPTLNEAKFVRNGKADIRVVLTGKSPVAAEKLKALGFEIESTKDGIDLTGRIAVEKLAALAEVEAVKLVLPRTK